MNPRYEELSAAARGAFVQGRLEKASEIFGIVMALARREGDEAAADKAFCNRCAVLVELDAVRSEVPELQRILLRSTEPKTRWMAAYYTAVAFDLDGDRQRAASFAQRALDLAPHVDEPETEAATANLLGNLALLSSRFDDAEAAFERALAAYGGLGGYHRLMAAQVRDNLGYTHLCTDRIASGLTLCESARNDMRELEASHYLAQTLQDLSYGYILGDELTAAREHGEEGLKLARVIDDRLIIKNSLFLLAEVSVREGDEFRARRFLGELTRCYPEVGPSEEIVDLLLGVDLTRVVNLRG